MAEVEVIKAVDGPILRKRDYEGNPGVITRQRVAAYVRVSTDGDEQLESFQSQKQYYQDKISENRDWVMVAFMRMKRLQEQRSISVSSSNV